MSWQAVTWVLEQSESELGSRLVLLSIASHASREGLNAYPTLDTITRETLMSRREVIYCIQSMEESGELHVDRGGGRGNPNCYSLPFVRAWVEKVQAPNGRYAKKEKVQGVHRLLSRKGAPKGVKGAIDDTKGCNALDVTLEESTTSPLQPLEEPSKAVTVSQFLPNISIPKPSKPLSRSEVEAQKAELRRRGFLQ